MIGALLYLQFHSAVNRFQARLRRLKQPKYLVGAIVGALWFYFYFFRWMFIPHRRGGAAALAGGIDPLFFELLAALIFFVIVLLTWLIPGKRAALSFTEAETAFLFPAPVSRTGLIHFKLLRSQWRTLISVLFLALVSNRFGSGRPMLSQLVGWWLILVTFSLHSLGASFARTILFDRGISNWRRRFYVTTILACIVGFVAVWASRTLPPFSPGETIDLAALGHYGRDLLLSGPMPYLLFPFRIVVRPYFAPSGFDLLVALGPALLLMVTLYAWVMLSNVAFEEASIDASRRDAERIAAFRSARAGLPVVRGGGVRAPFSLSPTGPPAVALFWKNLISAGKMFSPRRWIVLAILLVAMPIGLSQAGSGTHALGSAMAAMFAFWAVMLGPQLFRHDFRQDLPVADILKTYPLRGWQVATGELLAPAAILTGVQWLLLILLIGFGSQLPGLSKPLTIAVALSAGLILPALNLITLLIPNAAVLLFPAWFQTGKDAPQGIEASGQRILFALGQLLALAIALILPAAIFAAAFFAIRFFAGPLIAVPVASLGAAAVLGVEAVVGIGFLGRLFDRLDLSAET